MNKEGLLRDLDNIRKALYTIRSNIPDKTDFIHQTDKNRIDRLHRNYELLLKTIDSLERRVKLESGVSNEQLKILTYLKENPGVSTEVIGCKIVFAESKRTNVKVIGSNLSYLEKRGYVKSKYELYKTYHEKDPNRQVIKRVYYWTLTGKGRKMVV